MPKDKFLDKPFEKSYSLVIVACLVVAVLMPFINALARGNDVAVAASYAAVAPASIAAPSSPTASMADELSIVGFGAFLLGLGVILRKIA